MPSYICASIQEVSDAYREQNTFLTREIVELNELRVADAESIKSLKRLIMSYMSHALWHAMCTSTLLLHVDL